jgi:hypothetical protein
MVAGRAVLRVADRFGPCLAPDTPVLTAGRPHPFAYRGDREDVKRDLGGMLGGLGDLIGGDK